MACEWNAIPTMDEDSQFYTLASWKRCVTYYTLILSNSYSQRERENQIQGNSRLSYAASHTLMFASAAAINDLTTKFRTDEETVVAYFYFDFRDIQKQNAKGMAQSLIYQICKRKPAIPDAVFRLWDQYRHNTRAQEPGLKDHLLPALKESLVGFKRIYIVLDGLDECSSENNDLRTLLTTLNSIHQ
jgi:hypothetical protein